MDLHYTPILFFHANSYFFVAEYLHFRPFEKMVCNFVVKIVPDLVKTKI